MSWLKRWLIIASTMLLCLMSIQPQANAAGYNWRKANMWALLHAQDNQPSFNGCAWFVSNALWAGGMARDTAWHDNAVRPGKTFLPGTPIATVAEELYNHLVHSRGKRSLEITDRYRPGNNPVPEARPGDVIAYDWEGDGHVDHVAFVVHIGANSYPDVSEWGSAPNGKVSPYQMRGWSWSANQNKWQRQISGYQNLRAYLVMIR